MKTTTTYKSLINYSIVKLNSIMAEVLQKMKDRVPQEFLREVLSSSSQGLNSMLDQACQEKIKCQYDLLAKVTENVDE